MDPQSNGCFSRMLGWMRMVAVDLCLSLKKAACPGQPAPAAAAADVPADFVLTQQELELQLMWNLGVLPNMHCKKKTQALLEPGGCVTSSSTRESEQSHELDPLVVLPVEVIARIFSNLPLRTCVAATSVNRNWNLVLFSRDFVISYGSFIKEAGLHPEEWLVELRWCNGYSRTERGLQSTAFDRTTNTCYKLPHPMLEEEVELVATSSNGKALMCLCAGASMVHPNGPQNLMYLSHSEILKLVVWDPMSGSTWGPIQISAAHTLLCPPPCQLQHGGPIEVSVVSFEVGEDEAHPGKVVIKELSILARHHCSTAVLVEFVGQQSSIRSPWAVSIQPGLNAGYVFGQQVVCGQARWMLVMNHCQEGCCDLFRAEWSGHGPTTWIRVIHNVAEAMPGLVLSHTMQEHGGSLFLLGYKFKRTHRFGMYTRCSLFKVPTDQIPSTQDTTDQHDRTWKLYNMQITKTPEGFVRNSTWFRRTPVDWLLTTDGHWAFIRFQQCQKLMVADLTSTSPVTRRSWEWHNGSRSFSSMHGLLRGNFKSHAAFLVRPQLHSRVTLR